MKLLIIGHPLSNPRQVWTFRKMAELYKDIEIVVVAPNKWDYDPFYELEEDVPKNFIYYRFDTEKHLDPMYRIKFQDRIRSMHGFDIVYHMGEIWQQSTTDSIDYALERSSIPVVFLWENINTVQHENWRRIKYVVAGNSDAKKIAAQFTPQENIDTIVQGGVNLDLFKNYNKRKNEYFTIGFAGRFSSDKGFDKLYNVIKRLFKEKKDIVLNLAGFINDSGKDLSYLVKQLQELFPGRIRVANNRVDYELMPKFYNNIDLFIYNSIPSQFWKEQSMGYSNAEAMACGVPVITTDNGAIKEYLSDNIVKKISFENNEEDLYRIILELINNNQLRKELSKNGESYIKDNFSIEKIAEKHMNFFKRIQNEVANVL